MCVQKVPHLHSVLQTGPLFPAYQQQYPGRPLRAKGRGMRRSYCGLQRGVLHVRPCRLRSDPSGGWSGFHALCGQRQHGHLQRLDRGAALTTGLTVVNEVQPLKAHPRPLL